jgi:hypothetical protein
MQCLATNLCAYAFTWRSEQKAKANPMHKMKKPSKWSGSEGGVRTTAAKYAVQFKNA